MASFECEFCHTRFIVEAALREHHRTSMCAGGFAFSASDPRLRPYQQLTAEKVKRFGQAYAASGYTIPTSLGPSWVTYDFPISETEEPRVAQRPLTASEVRELIYRETEKSHSAYQSLYKRYEQLAQEIALLRKQMQTYSLDPKLHKAVRDPIDYTKMFNEDEDGLEDDYRGWPKPPKGRVVF